MKKILLALLFASALLVTGCNKKTTANSSIAQTLSADFTSKVSANSNISMDELAEKLISNKIIPFAGASMSVEPGFLNGFTSEVTGFSEGALFGPMIGSIPFIGYVFKVDGNPEQFIKTLKEKADLRWNICTQADEMVSTNVGNTVFFVMAPLNFDEE